MNSPIRRECLRNINTAELAPFICGIRQRNENSSNLFEIGSGDMTTASYDVGGVISPRPYPYMGPYMAYMAIEPRISDWKKLQRRPESEPVEKARPVGDVLGYPRAKTNTESKR